MNMITEHMEIERYEETLYQPWNNQVAKFDVVYLYNTYTCCPNQGVFETTKPIRVWMDNITPSIAPLGQCGQCGQMIYPAADVVETGEAIPEWLLQLAAKRPCEYCEQRTTLGWIDGALICELCYDWNKDEGTEWSEAWHPYY